MRARRSLVRAAALVGAALCAAGPARADDPDTVSAAIRLIEARYGERVDPTELWRAATVGVAAGLDRQLGVQGSAVLTAAQHEEVRAWLGGARNGIGCEFSIAPGQGLLVTDVFGGGPGEKAGLQSRDLIVSVDGHPLIGLPPAAMLAVATERRGDRVRLEIRRGDALKSIEVARGPYRVSAVTRTDDARPTLRITFFGDGTARSLAKVLGRLPADTPAVVLDLRDNEGGLVDEAIEAADLFLDEGAVVALVEGPDGHREPRVAEKERAWRGEVVALVNHGTRGVAEAFVAALRAHGVARLVGTRSAGSDAVPSFHPLGDGLVLQLPEHTLVDPTGRSWRNSGLEPDLLVEPVASSLAPAPGALPPDLEEDAAIQLIRRD